MNDNWMRFIDDIMAYSDLKQKLAMLKEFKKACIEVEFSKEETDDIIKNLSLYIFLMHFKLVPEASEDDD